MVMANKRSVIARLTQKRRLISFSSGFSSAASAKIVLGSSVMPQIGQLPAGNGTESMSSTSTAAPA